MAAPVAGVGFENEQYKVPALKELLIQWGEL